VKKFVLFAAVFAAAASLGALDFGMVLGQTALFKGVIDKDTEEFVLETGYAATLTPRLSFSIGNSMELFFAARLNYDYVEAPYLVPELLRAEFLYHTDRARLAVGRMQYTAPFEYVADSSFDGVRADTATMWGNFYYGLWFTGLLYKKSANIIITDDDAFNYMTPVDYGNFVDTYFASRRLVSAFGWENPAVAGIINAKAAIAGQYDLNNLFGRDTSYMSSLYFMGRFTVPFGNFSFELGGLYQIAVSDLETGSGFTWDVSVNYYLHTKFPTRFTFSGYFSLDDGRDTLPNLVPINTKTFGMIADASPSGIAAFSFDYAVRINSAVSVSAGTMYYVRSSVLNAASQAGINSFRLIENEIYAQAVWSPLSDFQMSLGGGLDISSDPKWKIKLGMILALL